MKTFFSALCLMILAATAQAEYPDRPIRLIVPFPAGTATDIVARQVAAEMTKVLKQPIVVDNKAGAQTIIGTQAALAAPADGYTLLAFGTSNAAINVSLFTKLPYSPAKDFTAIAQVAESSTVLVTSMKVTAASIGELIQYGRANPGKLTYGYGSGSAQVAGQSFAAMAGINILPVAYKGAPQVLTDVMSGEIDFTFIDYFIAAPQIKAGKIKALGVTSKERFSLAPELPPVHETLAGYDIRVFFGFAGPAPLPADVVARLTSAIEFAVKQPETVQRFADLGLVVKYAPSADYAAYVQREIDNWAGLIKAAGISPQDTF